MEVGGFECSIGLYLTGKIVGVGCVFYCDWVIRKNMIRKVCVSFRNGTWSTLTAGGGGVNRASAQAVKMTSSEKNCHKSAEVHFQIWLRGHMDKNRLD